MLIGLIITLLFLGGRGEGLDVFTKEHRKLVQQIVADEVRAEAVVTTMESAQKSVDGFVKKGGDLTKSWQKIDADRNSGRGELEPMFREADEYRSDALQAFADSIFEMREQVTAEEWEALHRGTQDVR